MIAHKKAEASNLGSAPTPLQRWFPKHPAYLIAPEVVAVSKPMAIRRDWVTWRDYDHVRKYNRRIVVTMVVAVLR
jgi:hypothetical protein